MVTFKVICPLINFQIPLMLVGHAEMTNEEVMNYFKEREKELTNGIELVDGLKIRRISKEDFEDLLTYCQCIKLAYDLYFDLLIIKFCV